ncbi:MAG: DUF975 family protein [Lachnospiraceae bacterium]|nr:DUF975 family protein [Lachnospiraceae bacterium]
MWTISELKEKGTAALKGNYWYCVLVAFIFTVCAGGSGGSASSSTTNPDASEKIKQTIENTDSAAVVTLMITLLSIAIVAILIAVLVEIFLLNPLQVSCNAFFMRNVSDNPASLNELKEGFNRYGNKVLTMFLKKLFTFLWGCLFLIPAFIKHYSYMMVPYILADEPDLGAMEAITKSREMMNGNKWKAFCLDLSFIGWILLSILTCGILAIFWTNPYMLSTHAALYDELKNNQ